MKGIIKSTIFGLSLLLASNVSLTACKKDNSEGWQPSPVDIAFNQELLKEHNYVRTKPKEYAEKVLKPAMANYSDKTKTVAQGLYDQLVKMEPVGKLELDETLQKAAQWFADDHARSGKTGHIGSDGSRMDQRIDRAGGEFRTMAENCSYELADARDVMLGLLIDEGIPGFGHRKNILNPAYSHMGAGKSSREGVPYGTAIVIDYGGY